MKKRGGKAGNSDERSVGRIMMLEIRDEEIKRRGACTDEKGKEGAARL